MDPLRMLVRPGTQWVLETGRFDLRLVYSEEECEAALSEGWLLSQYDVGKEPQPEVNADPTRADLEQMAADVGLKVDKRWSDKRLMAEIASKK